MVWIDSIVRQSLRSATDASWLFFSKVHNEFTQNTASCACNMNSKKKNCLAHRIKRENSQIISGFLRFIFDDDKLSCKRSLDYLDNFVSCQNAFVAFHWICFTNSLYPLSVDTWAHTLMKHLNFLRNGLKTTSFGMFRELKLKFPEFDAPENDTAKFRSILIVAVNLRIFFFVYLLSIPEF